MGPLVFNRAGRSAGWKTEFRKTDGPSITYGHHYEEQTVMTINKVTYEGGISLFGLIKIGQHRVLTPLGEGGEIVASEQGGNQQDLIPAAVATRKPALVVDDVGFQRQDGDMKAGYRMSVMTADHLELARLQPGDVIEVADGNDARTYNVDYVQR